MPPRYQSRKPVDFLQQFDREPLPDRIDAINRQYEADAMDHELKSAIHESKMDDLDYINENKQKYFDAVGSLTPDDPEYLDKVSGIDPKALATIPGLKESLDIKNRIYQRNVDAATAQLQAVDKQWDANYDAIKAIDPMAAAMFLQDRQKGLDMGESMNKWSKEAQRTHALKLEREQADRDYEAKKQHLDFVTKNYDAISERYTTLDETRNTTAKELSKTEGQIAKVNKDYQTALKKAKESGDPVDNEVFEKQRADLQTKKKHQEEKLMRLEGQLKTIQRDLDVYAGDNSDVYGEGSRNMSENPTVSTDPAANPQDGNFAPTAPAPTSNREEALLQVLEEEDEK